MKHNQTGKEVVFSEEYTKITKGMFVVWMNHAREESSRRHVEVLLNREHWAFEEAQRMLGAGGDAAVHRLAFDMPSTCIKRTFAVADRMWLLRAIRFVTGQTLNFLCSPLIVLHLWWRLGRIRPWAVFSHTGGWPAGPLCRWMIVAAALAGVPRRILIIHNYPLKEVGLFAALKPLRWIQAWLMDTCATSIVTVSDSVKAVLEAEVFSSPVVRIHNGIPLSPSVSAPASTPLDWHPSGAVVGFVGALYPLKGPHVLLDAFRLVEAPCELALLGPCEPDYLKSLQERARLCRNPVTFLGFHQDVDSFMERIELLVVPSIAFESFGMVILEAMRHRKPVICTDFGGMKEVVQDGVTGLVVPAGDAAALARAIADLICDAATRRRMGDAGYQLLNERFTSGKMADQYNELAFRR
jgi:teichuronic acid biosynthesis glycosyltransferase TuaC